MVKIVIGGQMAKEEILNAVTACGGDRVIVKKSNDMQAAMEVKAGAADFYLGSCNTGGGGSLAMVIAMCGYGQCVTVASPGKVMSAEEIKAQVQSGKKCFGFVPESINTVVPVLVEAMIAKKG